MKPMTYNGVSVGSTVVINEGARAGRTGSVEVFEWAPGVVPWLTVKLDRGGYVIVDADQVRLADGAA